jgi:OOP family OmpA-OmpF porin
MWGKVLVSHQSFTISKAFFRNIALLSLVVCWATACATGGGISRKDVLVQYPAIDKLSNAVSLASNKNAAILVPTRFNEATAQLDKAIEHAQDAEKDAADQAARAGLKAIAQTNASLSDSREVFSEVMETRDRARSAGAADIFQKRFSAADDALRTQATKVEQGNVNAARDSLPQLVRTYAQLELEALKKGTLEAARQAVNRAEDNEADEYAPRTLRQAKQELKLLESLIEADRTQTAKADTHARRTVWLAHRADHITELAKQFEAQDLADEGKILWFQKQLLRIREPLAKDLPFDKPNATVVNTLRKDIKGLLTSLADMRDSHAKAQQHIARLQRQMDKQRLQQDARLQQALADLRSGKEARIAALQRKIAEQASEKAADQRRAQAAAQRFERVQGLISREQGEVLRQGNNVILRLHGFYFPPGKTTIEAKNFGLLNSVIAAINTFPDSTVRVEGHTDSQGSDKLNLDLSQERARNVEAFLETTGGISESRLRAEGRGESQPVATNETKEGRAKNRRIEVLIINDQAHVDGQ